MAETLRSNEAPELSYFTCTLGQAAAINAQNPHGFKTVNDFIDRQARVIPQNPAVGFPIPPTTNNDGTDWQYKVFSMVSL